MLPDQRPAQNRPDTLDVLIVGGGFVGSVLTAVLRDAGYRTHTVDRTEQYPDAFRAEKLEPDQSALLRRFALLHAVSPPDTEISRVLTFENGRMRPRHHDGQFGIRYHDTVNSLRRLAQERGSWSTQRVTRVGSDDQGAIAHTADGGQHRARLCVIASGSPALLANSGVAVAGDAGLTSLSFGFDVESLAGGQLQACNYHSEAPGRDHVHYATLFPIGEAFRVNVFTSWALDEARTRHFAEQPDATMRRLFPRLQDFVGAFRCTTRVQIGRTTWHRVQTPSPDGVVVLGDAYQSVSPATGMGLSKCLTDVEVLLRHLAAWREHVCVPGPAIDALYQDPAKRRCDDQARDAWRWFHDFVHGRSLKARLRRSGLLRAASRVVSMGRAAAQGSS